MNKTEDCLLNRGKILLKSNYVHFNLVRQILRDPNSLDETNLFIEHGNFQIEGNTIFHIYALDAEKLLLITEFMIENNKNALSGILVRNHEGHTPFDIAIKNDSTKTIDILLKALAELDDGKYSSQLYTHFPKLIRKGLKSFHDYLDTCTFQTVQMRNMKYLALKKEDADQILASHSSCLLDRYFLEKHTVTEEQNKDYIDDRKKIMDEFTELQKRKKRLDKQEEKLKAHKGENNGTANPEDVQLQEKSLNRSPGKAFNDSNDEDSGSYDSEEEEDEDENESDNDVGVSKLLPPAPPFEGGFKYGSTSTRDPYSEIIAQRSQIEKEEKELKEKETKLEKDRIINIELSKKDMKRYEIKAIEFDWLFNSTDGKTFLEALAKTQHIDIFSVPTIANIVTYLWDYYRKQIIYQVLIPFLAYFTVFLIYATWINHEKNKEGKDWHDQDGDYFRTNTAMFIFTGVGVLWMGYFELRQLIYYKFKYFYSFWNWVDI